MNRLPQRIFKSSSSIAFQSKLLSTKIESRCSQFSVLNDKDISFFENILGKSHCITDPDMLHAFNNDWMKICQGNSKLVLLPTNTDELSAVLKYCNERSLAVCPQGGNTGLVGGSVPVYDEVIVSTKLMNKIIGLDHNSSILSAQSGCILQNLDEYLDKTANLMMPLDLGAKGKLLALREYLKLNFILYLIIKNKEAVRSEEIFLPMLVVSAYYDMDR